MPSTAPIFTRVTRAALASALAAALLALAGCATIADSTQQEIEVRTVLDHREVADIGCVVSNRNGRWFVTTPGRVTVRKSDDALSFDCSKRGVGSSLEAVGSQYGASNMLGNAALTAGLGYYLDRRTGAGFDYPTQVTVLMRPDHTPIATTTEAGSSMY